MSRMLDVECRLRERDEISIIEAAYALTDNEQTWLTGIAEAARALMDDGLGAFAWTIDLSEHPPSFGGIVGVGTPEGLIDVIPGLHTKVGESTVSAAYDPTAFTLSEKLGDLTKIDSLHSTMQGFGVADSLGLTSVDLPGVAVLTVGWPQRRPAKTNAVVRRRGARLIAHLTSAYRLRRRLSDVGPDLLNSAAAILSPAGAVEHAEKSACSPSALSALRQAVISQERARGALRSENIDAALELWRGLVQGKWSVVDHCERGGRRYLIALENPPEVAKMRRLTPREARVMALGALGYPSKLIAYQLGLPTGTASALLASARKKTGFRTRQELIRWYTETFQDHHRQ